MKQFNERSGGLLEMFQIHGFAFSYEAVRNWEVSSRRYWP
jgi:hypothetical protein